MEPAFAWSGKPDYTTDKSNWREMQDMRLRCAGRIKNETILQRRSCGKIGPCGKLAVGQDL
jgi:hypothetical protein